MPTQWQSLDRSTRKALLRGEAMTDPDLVLTARAEAERVLNGSPWPKYARDLAFAIPIGIVLGILSAVTNASLLLISMPVVIGALIYLVVGIRHRVAMIRILNTDDGYRPEPVSGVEARPLVINVSGREMTVIFGRYLMVIAVPVIPGLLLSMPALLGLAAIIGLPVIWVYAQTMLVYVLPKRPMYVLDGESFFNTRPPIRVPWSSVTEIRVMPMHGQRNPARQVVTFVLLDDEIYLARLSRMQALIARGNRKTYLSPFVIVDSTVDRSVTEIAEAAAALSGLPVVRQAPAL
jgi:hypothetical protein